MGSLIWRVVGPVSPSYKARLLWATAGGSEPGKAIVTSVVRRGDVALDVGANIGIYTDRLAVLVGRAGTVYALEPNPHYARDLRRIASRRKNVRVIAAAASDRPGTASLSVPIGRAGPNASLGSLEDRATTVPHEVIEVPTTTLDAEAGGISGVRFVKCDVEGHEHEVLLGGLELFRRERPILLIEIEQRHRRRPVAETFELLHDIGYDGYMLTASGPRQLAGFDVSRDQLDVIARHPSASAPPPEYVNNFVFMPHGMGLPS